MLPMEDTRGAKKRRRLDKEKEDYIREIMLLQQNTAAASIRERFLSSPKSHYMYNVPLIPKVVCFLAELIIVLSS